MFAEGLYVIFLYAHTGIFEQVTAVDLHLGENIPAPSQVSLLQGTPLSCAGKLGSHPKADDAPKNKSAGRTLTRYVRSCGVGFKGEERQLKR